MTLDELRAEAEKLGYRLAKIPDYDCSCYRQYPNEGHKHKNGCWKCVDRFERIEDYKPRNQYSIVTKCRSKRENK